MQVIKLLGLFVFAMHSKALSRKGTTLVMINSVCGCAGGIARPAAANAVHYDKRPDHLVTVFAGQDKEATERARTYFEGYPPLCHFCPYRKANC